MGVLKVSKNQGRIYVSYQDTVSGKLYSSYINKDYLNTTKIFIQTHSNVGMKKEKCSLNMAKG